MSDDDAAQPDAQPEPPVSDEHAVAPEDLPAYQIKRPKGPPAAGVLLVALGLAWLLSGLGVVELDTQDYLVIALGAVGLTLVASVTSHARGGLVVLGLILATMVATGDAVGVGDGDFGQKTVTPSSLDDLADEYRHGTGALTVDLRKLDADAVEDEADGGDSPLDIDAELGIGRLRIIMPDDVSVAVDARVGIGPVSVDGEGGQGGDGALIRIDARVGIGSVEVVDG